MCAHVHGVQPADLFCMQTNELLRGFIPELVTWYTGFTVYFICSGYDGMHLKVKDARSLDEDTLPGSPGATHSKLFNFPKKTFSVAKTP